MTSYSNPPKQQPTSMILENVLSDYEHKDVGHAAVFEFPALEFDSESDASGLSHK